MCVKPSVPALSEGWLEWIRQKRQEAIYSELRRSLQYCYNAQQLLVLRLDTFFRWRTPTRLGASKRMVGKQLRVALRLFRIPLSKPRKTDGLRRAEVWYSLRKPQGRLETTLPRCWPGSRRCSRGEAFWISASEQTGIVYASVVVSTFP